jgi:hypothetical protein
MIDRYPHILQRPFSNQDLGVDTYKQKLQTKSVTVSVSLKDTYFNLPNMHAEIHLT